MFSIRGIADGCAKDRANYNLGLSAIASDCAKFWSTRPAKHIFLDARKPNVIQRIRSNSRDLAQRSAIGPRFLT
jgi:hypothetical protein